MGRPLAGEELRAILSANAEIQREEEVNYKDGIVRCPVCFFAPLYENQWGKKACPMGDWKEE